MLRQDLETNKPLMSLANVKSGRAHLHRTVEISPWVHLGVSILKQGMRPRTFGGHLVDLTVNLDLPGPGVGVDMERAT